MAWVERIAPAWEHWDFLAGFARPLPQAVRARFDEPAAAFEIRFLEDVLARVGEDGGVLEQLGHLYTEAGRYRDGLAIDRRIVALKPRDPLAHYNLACSLSLLDERTRALSALRKAIDLGYRDLEYMQQDPDLENLRQDPRWEELLSVLPK